MRKTRFMCPRALSMALRLLAIAVALSTGLLLAQQTVSAGGRNGFYQQTNLVSDLPGVARVTDPNLVNSWGIVHGPTTPFWIADNGTGVSTLYDGAGNPFPVGSPLVVTIPPPKGSPAGTTATPTGTVFNPTSGFVVSEGNNTGAALFLFATEDGTISGWNRNVDPTHAILKVDKSPGAVYKGLALASNSAGTFLYATNFHAGTIDVFNDHFYQTHLAGSFTDPKIPHGYAPFGIAVINGNLVVTYAKQDADKHDDVAGQGHGFVDVFDTSGHLLDRLVTRGQLNSPWGLALAPASFGRFGGDLLIGNFGNGRINAYDPHTGGFRGQLRDAKNKPISIDGLWGLDFGNDANAGPSTTLFFTAGLNDEADGLFGSLAPVGR
ncbi:MAG TPA: TIGR03118 family protein [Ktedonobacterales bacterium]